MRILSINALVNSFLRPQKPRGRRSATQFRRVYLDEPAYTVVADWADINKTSKQRAANEMIKRGWSILMTELINDHRELVEKQREKEIPGMPRRGGPIADDIRYIRLKRLVREKGVLGADWL